MPSGQVFSYRFSFLKSYEYSDYILDSFIFFLNLFLFFFLYFILSLLLFKKVICIPPMFSSITSSPHLPLLVLPPFGLSMGSLYMLLNNPSPSFPHYPLPLSPLVTVFVLYFHVCGYILLAGMFCWLGSTYRWDHTVFVFHSLLISLGIMLSSSIHACCKG